MNVPHGTSRSTRECPLDRRDSREIEVNLMKTGLDNPGAAGVLETPALVVDLVRLERNIDRMARLAESAGVSLRPHIKSHKTPWIARLQVAAGASGLTVAKLGEAEAMFAEGFGDIFIAYEIVGEDKIRRLLSLSSKARVGCAVDNLEAARELDFAAGRQGRSLEVLIEVDTGLGRCGVPPGPETVRLYREVAALPNLKLRGIFTHAGHAYAARTPAEVEEVARHEGRSMAELAELLRREGLRPEVVSVGSTPTVPHSALVPGVTEIRPGNYVFNDAIQIGLGVAAEDDCALRVLATVISRSAPDRAVIDAGSKSLGLDRGAHGVSLVPGFGRVVGHPDLIVERLSEEHGILRLPGGYPLPLGTRVEIIPNHACPVANLFDRMVAIRGGEVERVLEIKARGMVT